MKFNSWYLSSFLVSFVVAIPILTVFASFFQETTNYFDILKIDCCVILGHKANNTFGNAMETARWMASEGFNSIHIVTANYHLPRSLLEFDRVLPNMKLFSHVVHPEKVHLNEWWRWPGTIRLLLAEYNKYLVTKLRILLISN